MAGFGDDRLFAQASERLIQWLISNGASISNKIQLADLRTQGAGRGVVATENINEDEELFRIPRSLIFTAENSSLPSNIREQINDPWLSLIAAMADDQLRESTKWQPYWDVMPEHFDTLMFWSSDELALLQGSAVVAKIGKESADKAFNEHIIPLVGQHNHANKNDLLALCHKMGSTIMASAFDLEAPERERPQEGEEDWEEDDEDSAVMAKGMVPLADMLNADADRNNAKLFYEDEFVAMKAIKAIQPGSEIFNDYGPLPQADVLRRYGYTTQNYAKYDVVEISLDLIRAAVQQQTGLSTAALEERTEYLDGHGILDDGYDIARRENEDGQFPEELCLLLAALLLPPADFDKMKTKDKLPKPDWTPEMQNLMYGILVRRRAMYDFDEPRIEQLTGRPKMAASVVHGEKLVLQEAADAVQAMSAGASNKRKADTFLDEARSLREGSKR
ncbi:hypothetical protein R9X50_00374400 [Acrodontium crateriforme]|uniref:SET domain-containing protein n=1 Tax=Acrodontium crateriforme TaxID=150365 RepID=A0AAQ3M408_9PEZI|nr:hypothetical protein R9X50_00374400 [Acrodontium crateriforme]